jgi:hypothetical protein
MAAFTVLEPMSTGDVIDRAVRLYRRNFVPLISIVAVPSVIGYIVALMFWFGYTNLLLGAANQTPTFRGDALLMMAIGAIGYPIWLFTLLLTISGLSRCVGDHVMLGEPITFRRCFSAAKKRFGAITLMGLLGLAFLFGAYIIFSILFFVVFLAISAIAGVIAAAQVPQWVVIVLMTLMIVVVVVLLVLTMCVILARIVFMPQAVMIEGQGAASALGRAFSLGKGNWHKVGAIALFTYFISTSLFAALTLPVLAGLYLAGMITAEFLISPTWSILYTSFRDISGLLSLPIWVVSFTLLYFDSRVRKEGYDLELLARQAAPEFVWAPAVQPSAFGYQMAVPQAQTRTFVQTSPLGLAGYDPRTARVAAGEQVDDLRRKFEHAAASVATPVGAADAPTSEVDRSAWCTTCGADLRPTDSFCMQCGSPVMTGEKQV